MQRVLDSSLQQCDTVQGHDHYTVLWFGVFV